MKLQETDNAITQASKEIDQRNEIKGTKSSMPLTHGWLTVREALRLPQPDTSWMSNPMARSGFTAWLPIR